MQIIWPFEENHTLSLSNLSSICFIDKHEILVPGLPLRFSTKQLVPKKKSSVVLLIPMILKTAVLWSYGVEFSTIVWKAGFNSRYFSRIGKKVIRSYIWNIIFWIPTTLSSRNIGEVSAIWCVLISLIREILRMFVTRKLW